MPNSADNAFLEFAGAGKSFEGLNVFADLSFSLKQGAAYGLVGPNACGKTTLLHSAMGLTHLSSGTVRYRGSDVTNLKPHSIARMGLGIVLQNVGIFDRISVLENVMTGMAALSPWNGNKKNTLNQSHRERAEAVLSEVGLKEDQDRLAGALVPGEQKRLALARILFSARDFLLDEPMSGVDLQTRDSVQALIRRKVTEGSSILIIEHDIDFVLQTCDEVMMLKGGHIVCRGTPDTVMQNGEFQQFYGALKVEDVSHG